MSVESRDMVDGTERFYARYTDPRGRRHVVKPPDGDSTWPDWGEAFTAGCVAQTESQRLNYRSRDGEGLLFRDLVRHHYLPSLRDASPNTRKNTASHLGDGSGVPTRNSPSGQRAARSQLLFAFGHLPIGGIGPSEVQQWISQMGADGYDVSTIRAKRSLLRTILRVAVDQGWLVQNVVEATRLPRPWNAQIRTGSSRRRSGRRSGCGGDEPWLVGPTKGKRSARSLRRTGCRRPSSNSHAARVSQSDGRLRVRWGSGAGR